MASLETTNAAPPDPPPVRLPYDAFLAERQRFVEARQRQQQRVDQLVTGGAAGALALSITFLEKIAPSLKPATELLLAGAWALLLACLGLTLRSHYLSCAAFDRAIADFDDCFTRGVPYAGQNQSTARAARYARWGAVAFVGGVFLLATFAFANLWFSASTQVNATSTSSFPREHAQPEADSAAPTPTASPPDTATTRSARPR